jgi:hypothetical protein
MSSNQRDPVSVDCNKLGPVSASRDELRSTPANKRPFDKRRDSCGGAVGGESGDLDKRLS